MHEFSLVRSLLEQVDDIVASQGGRAALEVRVEIGPLAGVEPFLVTEAFHQLFSQSRAAGANLVVDEVPLTARCANCNMDFSVQEFRFVCPRCESREIIVMGGDQFRLMSVTVDLPDPSDLEHESVPNEDDSPKTATAL